jgi:fumarate hydratase class I
MPDFVYQDPFPLGADETEYECLSTEHVSVAEFEGRPMQKVAPEALALLANEAMKAINYPLRPRHLALVAAILDAPEATENDRMVALMLLKNAEIAAKGILPACQDTGTATVVGKKGQQVWTGCDDAEWLSKGIHKTYQEENLRYSQTAPLTMYEEANTKTNLPAQIDLYASEGDAYKFLFVSKGGGSANKTFLYQETKALLNPKRLKEFCIEKMRSLGTAACPPYHLAIVIGGTSAELTMKTVKLASTKYLDELPTKGSEDGHAFRDLDMEAEVLKMTQSTGVGAQFGGKYFCHDVRVIRLPRHGASLPIGLGVSCAADRQALGKINRDGVFLEELERHPAQYLPDVEQEKLGGQVVKIDLRRPMKDILAQLSKYPVKTRLSLTGTMIVARDLAHAKLRERLEAGKGMPDYFKNHPIYYAGPAKTPQGYASGSFGPTTAGRMDSYIDQFQAAGGSMISLAKGNRSAQVRDACKKHGGFYLASIGGSAAKLAEQCIKKVEVHEYPELGMEAIWKIEVEDFPAFIVIDDKGNDFFKDLNLS